MLRFTIRDVLWLIAVVAAGLGAWSMEHRAALQLVAEARAREANVIREHGAEHFKFLAAFRGWASAKGESVFLDVDHTILEASPDGEVSEHSSRPPNVPGNVKKLRFKEP